MLATILFTHGLKKQTKMEGGKKEATKQSGSTIQSFASGFKKQTSALSKLDMTTCLEEMEYADKK